MALKRIRGEPLLTSRFSLGRTRLTINILALCFLFLVFVMIFFPAAPHPDGVFSSMELWSFSLSFITISMADMHT
ncbi:uncharacterized protein K441DRAFT_199711 [Cenococcum geophilum 1.58]|uniref:uncharacterized protein n=1 Tax=Cenococcum geophilum 1.58 TaxID=794803 RepID=UPI00358E1520|nr:hypothetical protein K441DRAFT_199711 [Cenococcum geophilum 1.58]